MRKDLEKFSKVKTKGWVIAIFSSWKALDATGIQWNLESIFLKQGSEWGSYNSIIPHEFFIVTREAQKSSQEF